MTAHPVSVATLGSTDLNVLSAARGRLGTSVGRLILRGKLETMLEEVEEEDDEEEDEDEEEEDEKEEEEEEEAEEEEEKSNV
ncbi:hypothetical protein D9611_005975 [Ephemerocybe angulata]|uniref:Uncharacterized protein n=1 Tax=Ephemerocybe angulata TaxID=980116 RepID=A0A8H5CHA1_9AGAR|nr:hypothetical protein D9611_005975 [Tulosesus angulatus]